MHLSCPIKCVLFTFIIRQLLNKIRIRNNSDYDNVEMDY